jgi:hypothetical protein
VKKMSEITLEKIDIIRERTGVTYLEAKEALESSEGNVVDALIYIEEKQKSEKNQAYATKEEFLNWLKEVVRKGNVTRIRIKKDEKVLADLPINGGIAVGVLAYLIWAPLLAIGVLTAVATKVTIEITKDDGSVEVINKLIKTTVDDVKDKVNDITTDVKGKVNDFTTDVKGKVSHMNSKKSDEENVYKYTVKFEDMDEEKDKI